MSQANQSIVGLLSRGDGRQPRHRGAGATRTRSERRVKIRKDLLVRRRSAERQALLILSELRNPRADEDPTTLQRDTVTPIPALLVGSLASVGPEVDIIVKLIPGVMPTHDEFYSRARSAKPGAPVFRQDVVPRVVAQRKTIYVLQRRRREALGRKAVGYNLDPADDVRGRGQTKRTDQRCWNERRLAPEEREAPDPDRVSFETRERISELLDDIPQSRRRLARNEEAAVSTRERARSGKGDFNLGEQV